LAACPVIKPILAKTLIGHCVIFNPITAESFYE
jgi:hypothetical protein